VPLSLGPFQLVRPLQSGGMGVVWYARHAGTGEAVAIKLLRGDDPDHAAALENEIRAAARLDHPSVLWIFDQGRVPGDCAAALEVPEGTPWFAMALCTEGTLLERRPASWAEVGRVALALLDALAHAHARGVLHRDLKPANLLFRREAGARRTLHLADFGLAHHYDGSPEAVRGGTLTWMAPEQLLGGEPGPWSDLYAVGALVWWMVCGAPPLRAKGVEGWMEAHGTGERSPFQPTLAVPDGLGAWLDRMLAPAPRQRFRRAADAAVALHALGGGEGATDLLWTGCVSAPADSQRDPWGRPAAPRDWRPPVPPPPRVHLPGAGHQLLRLRQHAFVGRDGVRDALWSAVREVAAGLPRVVVLEGPSGVGKSSLVQWLLERTHELGLSTGFLATHAADGGARHGVAGLLARSLRAPLDQPDALAQRAEAWIDDPALRQRTIALATGARPADWCDTVAQFLAARAEGRIPAVWVDDGQWADDALTFAAAVADGLDPILVLITVQREAREDLEDVADRLDQLVARPAVRRVVLGPIDAADRADVVQRLLPFEASLAAEIDVRTDGNPRFAVQLVTALAEHGRLVAGPHGYVHAGGALAVPPALLAEAAQRLTAALDLHPSGRPALEVAAVLGDPVSVGAWGRLCGQLDIAIPRGLLPALAALGLVELETIGPGQRWRFAQSLLREALLVGRDLRAHHAAVADDPDTSPDARGLHLLGAGDAAAAVPLLLAAAHRATIGGSGWRALWWWDRARAALQAVEAPTHPATLGRVVALRRVGRVAEARAELAALAAAALSGDDALALAREEGAAHAGAGALAAAVQVLDAAMPGRVSAGATVAVLAVHAQLAAAWVGRGALADGEAWARDVLAADAGESESGAAVARLALVRAWIAAGRLDDARFQVHAGLQTARARGWSVRLVEAQLALASLCLEAGQTDEAEAALVASRDGLASADAPLRLERAWLEGVLALQRDDLDGADRRLDDALRQANALAAAGWIARVAATRLQVAARRGHWAAVQTWDDRLRARSDDARCACEVTAYAVAACAAASEGSAARARAILEDALVAASAYEALPASAAAALAAARACVPPDEAAGSPPHRAAGLAAPRRGVMSDP
jgi:hypothetical protein